MSIVDRRKNFKGKSSPNRQKFIDKVEDKIKDQTPDMVDQKGLTDDNGVDVVIDGVDEPSFSLDKEDEYKIINGNDQFTRGDKIPKNPRGKGPGGKPGEGGFEEGKVKVRIKKSEFLDYFFDDFDLPNIEKINMNVEDSEEYKHAGYSRDGTPNRLNVKKSFKNKIGRDLAIEKSYQKKIDKLKKKLDSGQGDNEKIKEEIERLEKLKRSIPFMTETDLHYTQFKKKPTPSAKCKVIFIMDVSGSMGEKDRRKAKSFFMLLHIFLQKQYKDVDVHFIRHTGEAEVVNESEFFNGHMIGGTRIYPPMKLANEVISKQMSLSDDNIYIAQAGDGEVYSESVKKAISYLKETLMPKLQYMWYIEIVNKDRYDIMGETLLEFYRRANFNNFSQQKVINRKDIWKVFKENFSS